MQKREKIQKGAEAYRRGVVSVATAFLVLATAVGVFLFLDHTGSGHRAHAEAVCDPRSDIVPTAGGSFDPFSGTSIALNFSANRAAIEVTNQSDTCDYDLHLTSYEIFTLWDGTNDAEYLADQKRYRDRKIHLAAGETAVLRVGLPTCNFQVDLFAGPFAPFSNPDFGNAPLNTTHTLFDWAVRQDRPVCGDIPPPPPPPPPAPVCEIDMSPTVIRQGMSATLTWSSEHATHAVITSSPTATKGFGAVPVNGSRAVSPTFNTTYTGTFTGPGGTVMCEARIIVTNPPEKATLTLIKTVINDDGGTAAVSDFDLFINTLQVASGVTVQLDAGTYTASEINLPGYTAGPWTGNCSADGTVTLNPGDNKVCRIVNDDKPTVEPEPATLTLIKTVINDDGGAAVVSDFDLAVFYISGGDTAIDIPMTSGITQVLEPRTYTATETNVSGYTAGPWTGDCAADGSVTLNPGDDKVCRITNNDVPVVEQKPTLTLIKTVINDDGGTAAVPDFDLFINTLQVASGVLVQLDPGTYTASETNLTGYTAGPWTGDCSADGSVTLNPGDNKVCRIVNDDIGGGQCTLPTIDNQKPLEAMGTLGESFSYTLSVSHAGAVVVDESSLPRGLRLSTDGLTIQGAPQVTGTFSIPITIESTHDDPECQIETTLTIVVKGSDCVGCGGSFPPKVTLLSEASSTPLVLGSFVSLAQVPYTGVGSTLQIVLFFLGLIVGSGLIAYGLLRGSLWGFLKRFAHAFAHAGDSPLAVVPVQTPQRRAPQQQTEQDTRDIPDMPSKQQPEPPPELSAVIGEPTPTLSGVAAAPAVSAPAEVAPRLTRSLEASARTARALVSQEGCALIVQAGTTLPSVAGGTEEERAEATLAQVLAVAKTRFPREDGWLILDKKRVQEALFTSCLSLVPLFIEWIVRGESKKVFALLRVLRHQEQPVVDFIRKVVAELDNVHHARMAGEAERSAADQHVLEVTYHLSNKDLEAIIDDLLRGADESYDSPFTSVRLSLSRVLDRIRERSIGVAGKYEPSDVNQTSRMA